jgi:TRAP-type uncharacterized transport system fused permease subunit
MTARSGLPTQTQVIIGAIGLLVLLEAAPRARPGADHRRLALPALCLFGQGWLIPELIEHEGCRSPR